MNYRNFKRYPSNKHFHLTKKGLDDLRGQLDRLRKEQIGLCKRLLNMDQKEKEDYIISTDIGDRLDVIDSEVAKISDILQHADVIVKKKDHSDIGLGSVVFLESGLRKVHYKLVSSVEADPSANRISDNSPLGRALIGKKEQSVVSISSSRGKRFLYKILAIK